MDPGIAAIFAALIASVTAIYVAHVHRQRHDDGGRPTKPDSRTYGQAVSQHSSSLDLFPDPRTVPGVQDEATKQRDRPSLAVPSAVIIVVVIAIALTAVLLGLGFSITQGTLLVLILTGLVAGWLLGTITGSPFGRVSDLMVGVVGAPLGVLLPSALHIHFGGGIVAIFIQALIGAIVLRLVLHVVSMLGVLDKWRLGG
jgi:uncharacterized membrane protein YeaQ/YmgE (transglycosylase-associated protein family)